MIASLLLLAAGPAFCAPRLVVVVSVDQMRADYFERFVLTKGLARLKRESAFFTDARHVHLPTETGPGHAAILTGRYPGETGIVGNDWWDRRLGRDVYCMEDAAYGRGPEHLLAYALGDFLKAKDPLSKVVGVSLKDRAAILMTGKRADMALWFDPKKQAFITSAYYGAEPSWLAGFNAALPKGISKVGVTPQADVLVLDLAAQLLKRYSLGRDAHPDILAISFSATDYIGHKYGFEGTEMKAQMESLDKLVSDLLALAEKSAGPGGFDLVLTADHGVLPVPEGPQGAALKARRLGWEDLSRRVEAVLQELEPVPGRKWLLSNQMPNLYLDSGLAAERKLDWLPLLRRAAARLKTLDGVAEVYVGGEFPAGAPGAEAFARSFLPGRSGDLLLVPAYGVLFEDAPTGTSHGTPYDYDTRVPLLFWGPDFKAGVSTAPARVTDIAPTLARVLGIPFTSAEGSAARLEALAP